LVSAADRPGAIVSPTCLLPASCFAWRELFFLWFAEDVFVIPKKPMPPLFCLPASFFRWDEAWVYFRSALFSYFLLRCSCTHVFSPSFFCQNYGRFDLQHPYIPFSAISDLRCRLLLFLPFRSSDMDQLDASLFESCLVVSVEYSIFPLRCFSSDDSHNMILYFFHVPSLLLPPSARGGTGLLALFSSLFTKGGDLILVLWPRCPRRVDPGSLWVEFQAVLLLCVFRSRFTIPPVTACCQLLRIDGRA